MSWLKIDDAAPDHPKWMALADDPPLWAACWGLWVSCAAYCARQLTDGFVPRAYVTRATPLPHRTALAAAESLVRVGLWASDDAGYRFHDWLEYNPSAEEVRAKREAASRRMKNRRSPANLAGSSRELRNNEERTDEELREPFANPVPVPVPQEETLPAHVRARSVGAEHQVQPGIHDVYTRLHNHTRTVVVRHKAECFAPDPGPVAGRERVWRVINHVDLSAVRAGLDDSNTREATIAKLEHALDMVGVQAEAKAKSGEDSSYGLLASILSPGVLVAALACPDEATARQRAVRRLHGGASRTSKQTAIGSMPPRRAEEFHDVPVE